MAWRVQRALHREERDRLWQRRAETDEGLAALAARRSLETPVVEPRDATLG